MKENGAIIRDTARDFGSLFMVLVTRAASKMTKCTGKESSSLPTVTYMKETT